MNSVSPRALGPPTRRAPRVLQPHPEKRVPQAAPASCCSRSPRAHPSSMLGGAGIAVYQTSMFQPNGTSRTCYRARLSAPAGHPIENLFLHPLLFFHTFTRLFHVCLSNLGCTHSPPSIRVATCSRLCSPGTHPVQSWHIQYIVRVMHSGLE
jgi:hypothetical protein